MEDIIESLVMILVKSLKRWITHQISTIIKTHYYKQDQIVREKYLDKLRVLHQSEHFLVVNKHHDLVINTDPPDTRLSLFEQVAFKFPQLVNHKLGHGFYVAHRLDYSTVR